MVQKNKTLFIAQAAVIAALYTALSFAFAPISYGPVQMRVSEALCVLPYFTLSAVPGLFVGCLLSNLIGFSLGLTAGIDILVGSLATLMAAYLSYRLRGQKWLVPLPAVLVNAVVIGAELQILYMPEMPVLLSMLYVGIGQVAACYCIGMPLLLVLKKTQLAEKLSIV